jgi:hypothetical protein
MTDDLLALAGVAYSLHVACSKETTESRIYCPQEKQSHVAH